MKKSFIIKLILIVLILAIIVIFLLKYFYKEEEKQIEIKQENPTLTIQTEMQEENSEKLFIEIENCLKEYYSAIEEQNEIKLRNLLEVKNADVIKPLDYGFEKFRIKKIYSKEIEINKCQYYVFGEILGENYATIQDEYIIVNIDYGNNIFSILPTEVEEINYLEYESIIEQLSKEETKFTEISGNEDNILINVTAQTEEIIDYYFKDYIIMAIYYPEIGYNLLDEEYKNAKFDSLEEYKQFVQLNASKIENAVATSYRFDEKDGYIQYTITDNNDNAYVFKIFNTMDYKVIADMYTLNLETVSQKYNESKEQEKVAINIQKIVSALNFRDYKYVYSKLADSFKVQKYPTLESLKNELDSKLFGTFTVTFNNFNVEGTTYIYDIELTGRTASSTTVNMQIIMQLLENQDFVMSFNMEEVI